MSFIRSTKVWFFAGLFILLTTIVTNNAIASEGAFFIDALVLQQGKTTEDANAYFDKIEPIVKKHGLRRITPGLNVVKNMKGSLNADLINIWFVTNPATTFNDIFTDPEYLKHIKQRNSTFDMESANMMMLQPF